MTHPYYLLDTHAFVFWVKKTELSLDFIDFLDRESDKGRVLISTVSVWEIALLKKKGRIEIDDIQQWINEIKTHSMVKIIDPTVSDMIDSTSLPDYHNDPFDRLLIAQALNNNAILVTRDKTITQYDIETLWK